MRKQWENKYLFIELLRKIYVTVKEILDLHRSIKQSFIWRGEGDKATLKNSLHGISDGYTALHNWEDDRI